MCVVGECMRECMRAYIHASADVSVCMCVYGGGACLTHLRRLDAGHSVVTVLFFVV